MESPRTDADECEFISRSVQISPPSFRSTLTHAAHPRTLWSDPDGSTVVGSGAAATLVANGSDRVNTIRADAESLFSSGDVHAGTEAARPRLFGGFLSTLKAQLMRHGRAFRVQSLCFRVSR